MQNFNIHLFGFSLFKYSGSTSSCEKGKAYVDNLNKQFAIITYDSTGATIAQWIHLCLPISHPGFESQACHIRFYHLQSNLCYICLCFVKRTKIKTKRGHLIEHMTLGLYRLELYLENDSRVVIYDSRMESKS